MSDVTVRRIECDGCGAVEAIEEPGQPVLVWTRVAIDQTIPGAPRQALWHRTLCETCTYKLIGALDGLKAEADRLKGTTVPPGWP